MKVVIVGGNAAGMSAAAKLRRMDPEVEVVIYEKKEYISFGACGLPYYIGDFFSEESRMIVRTKEQAEKAGIKVHLHCDVISVDEKKQSIEVVKLENGEKEVVSYDKLMIASGARPIYPPITNLSKDKKYENLFTLRTLEDGRAIREKMLSDKVKNVAVIGAGFIGLELVDVAKHQGKEVSLFQLEERILKDNFDKEVTDILEKELIDSGVNLYLNTAVEELVGDSAITKVKANGMEYPVELVVIAAGIRPNTEFLEGTSVERTRNGAIIIDDFGKTSVPNIYAAGDCAVVRHILKEKSAYIPLATTANKIGRLVGENLAGGEKPFPGTLGASCLKLLSLEAGRVGLCEEEAKMAGIKVKSVFVSNKNHTDYYPGQESIHVKLICDSETNVILGGQIVGKSDAVMRTNVLSVAIAKKMTAKELGMMDFCYAPPFSRTWDVLNLSGNVCG